MAAPPARPSSPGASAAGLAPSWAKEGYLLPNGHATTAVVAGVVAVVLAAPFGPFGIALPLLVALLAGWSARVALARARVAPWRKGRSGGRFGLVCVGIVLAEVVTSVW